MNRPRRDLSLVRPWRRRRLMLVALVLATDAWFVWQTWALLAADGTSALERVAVGCMALLILPLALFFWVAVAGFARTLYLSGKRPAPYDAEAGGAGADSAEAGGAPGRLRTALVMPIYNEDPARVFAGVAAMLESLDEAAGVEHAAEFDFHVLSDTNDPETWLAEEAAVERLCSSLARPERLRYRNRAHNLERKSGNIAEFCATHGERYDAMIVLDADSLLDGDSVLALVESLERDPRAGIVQAPTVIVNRKTLFGRMLQFSASVYGRIAMHGLDFWLADQGNYWGHNAIIRIAPFVEHCDLPVLSGREPLGGSILSHDFVEAALMLRGGWNVRIAPEIRGSYEESPPSLVDYAARDRRWCQGNLQHLRLVLRPGFNFASRVQFVLGAAAYLASPLWLTFLVVGTVEALRQRLTPHEYFPDEETLFPVWHADQTLRTLGLVAMVVLLLFLPKILGVLAVARDRARVQAYGGPPTLAKSALGEALFSLLAAPVLAVIQSRFVIAILAGEKVGWNAQERDDQGTSWAEALRRHGGTTLLGIVWAAALAYWLPSFLLWLAPVLLGFLFAIPLSVWSSRASAGSWARRRGIFATPEELDPPRILARYVELLAEAQAQKPPSHGDAIDRIVSDPELRELHLEQLAEPDLDPLERHGLEGLILKRELRGPASLTRSERRALLLDPESVRALAHGRASPRLAPLASYGESTG